MPLLLAAVDWKQALDATNQFLTHPDFDKAIHNPWFLGISAGFCLLALFRGWKGFLTCYIGGLAAWGVVHHTVLKDRLAAADSTANVWIFAGLILVISGVAMYVLLIRD